MSYEFYKVLHIFGIVMLFTALGGTVLYALNGGTKAGNQARGLIGALHGTALLLILVAGFGMFTKHNLALGGWLWGKLAIWLALPMLGIVAWRQPQRGKVLLVVIPVLGLLAAWLAIYKPF